MKDADEPARELSNYFENHKSTIINRYSSIRPGCRQVGAASWLVLDDPQVLRTALEVTVRFPVVEFARIPFWPGINRILANPTTEMCHLLIRWSLA